MVTIFASPWDVPKAAFIVGVPVHDNVPWRDIILERQIELVRTPHVNEKQNNYANKDCATDCLLVGWFRSAQFQNPRVTSYAPMTSYRIRRTAPLLHLERGKVVS